MEHHPFLKELLQVCATHNVDHSKAYTTFEAFQELSQVRRLSDLTYFFSINLKLFYLSGKKDPTDEASDVYIPVMHRDEISFQEMNAMQEILSPKYKQDQDSSSTCYCITRGLVKPDSPETCKKKKELEGKKYHFEKKIQDSKKIFYTKALRQKRAQESANKE